MIKTKDNIYIAHITNPILPLRIVTDQFD